MKVKAREQKTVEKELDLEYPIYLIFPLEFSIYEYVKLFPTYEIVVTYEYSSLKIEKRESQNYTEYQLLNNQTSEEEFNNSFEEALQDLVKAK